MSDILLRKQCQWECCSLGASIVMGKPDNKQRMEIYFYKDNDNLFYKKL